MTTADKGTHAYPIASGQACMVRQHACISRPRCRLVHATEALYFAMDDVAEVCTVDMTPCIKLLAFHDDAFSVSLPPRRAADKPWVAFDMPADFRACDLSSWFVRELAAPSSDFTTLCISLRGTEAYRLVRFLLDQESGAKATPLSARYGLSEAHFRRKCKEVLGRSLKAELRLLRATRSLLELAHHKRSLTAVALDHGFSSPAHFSSEIKTLFGKSPSDLCRARITPETP